MYVDADLRRAMDADGIAWPPRAGQSNAAVEDVFSEDVYADTARLFYERGWGDGLPMVPPTEQCVMAMVRGTDLPRDRVLATVAPLMGQATVEKVAINAVMAGCRPAYLPVVIAAVEAMCDPVFDLVGVSTTTSPNATLVILNGPVAGQIDMNSGANALGRGHAANATIGRAVRLVEQNVGGAWPRVSDLSTIGMPGDYGMALAENEVACPWEPLHVEHGFEAGHSVVSVASVEGTQLVMDIDVDDRGFLLRVTRAICSQQRLFRPFLIVLAPSTASRLAACGWSKESIRQFIRENARVHISQVDSDVLAGGYSSTRGISEGVSEPDEDGMVTLSVMGDIEIIVAGGFGEKNTVAHLWSPIVSREVRLPDCWATLAAELSTNDAFCSASIPA